MLGLAAQAAAGAGCCLRGNAAHAAAHHVHDAQPLAGTSSSSVALVLTAVPPRMTRGVTPLRSQCHRVNRNERSCLVGILTAKPIRTRRTLTQFASDQGRDSE
jgi:hypothetical protein